MLWSRIRTLVTGVAAFGLAFGTGQLAATSAQAAEFEPEQKTVYYSASAYEDETDEAAEIWSESVPNLDMVEGDGASITVEATNSGGSRAYPCGLGCARILIDSHDVDSGHDPLRIVTHEIGHGHTLPDNYNGDCAILMSGGSAGTSCTNPQPSKQEADEVNTAYGSGKAATEGLEPDVYDPSSF